MVDGCHHIIVFHNKNEKRLIILEQPFHSLHLLIVEQHGSIAIFEHLANALLCGKLLEHQCCSCSNIVLFRIQNVNIVKAFTILFEHFRALDLDNG